VFKSKYLDKDVFVQQYLLSRTSHKKSGLELLKEASEIWESINTRSYDVKKD